MTIEKLSKALLDALQAQGAYVGELETPDGSVAIDGEVCPALVVRALLPLIAAELAGVAREHYEHGDEWYRHNKIATVGQTIALAIEAHARKMGEA